MTQRATTQAGREREQVMLNGDHAPVQTRVIGGFGAGKHAKRRPMCVRLTAQRWQAGLLARDA